VAGEFDAALDMLERALASWRKTGGKRGEASAVGEIAGLYARLNLQSQAERHYREALAMRRSFERQARRGQALIGLVSVMREGKDYAAAGQHLQSAREIARLAVATLRDAAEQGRAVNRIDLVATQNMLGVASWKGGDRDAAESVLTEALAGAKEIESPQEQAAAHAMLAIVRSSNGKLDEAGSEALAAITVIEDMRAGVASPTWRAHYLSRRQDVYRLGVDIPMRSGRLHEAFELSERGRARSLHDIVASRPQVGRSVGNEERVLRNKLRAKAAQLTRQLARPETKPVDTQALRRQIDELVQSYDAMTARIARDDHLNAKRNRPATIVEIQRHLESGDARSNTRSGWIGRTRGS
jgi:hypothetical protein